MDFAAIPADFDAVEQALETVDALGGESGDPPAAVDDLMAELDQTGAAGASRSLIQRAEKSYSSR